MDESLNNKFSISQVHLVVLEQLGRLANLTRSAYDSSNPSITVGKVLIKLTGLRYQTIIAQITVGLLSLASLKG